MWIWNSYNEKEAKDTNTLFIDKLLGFLLVHKQKVNKSSNEDRSWEPKEKFRSHILMEKSK